MNICEWKPASLKLRFCNRLNLLSDQEQTCICMETFSFSHPLFHPPTSPQSEAAARHPHSAVAKALSIYLDTAELFSSRVSLVIQAPCE